MDKKIIKTTEQLMKKGYTKDIISEKLKALGFDEEQTREIFRTIQKNKEKTKQKSEWETFQIMIMIGVIVIIGMGLAVVFYLL